MISIQFTIVRIHTTRNRQPAARIEHRPHDRRVSGAVVLNTHQRFNDATALNFVIVLANDPVLGRDVQRAKYLFQTRLKIVATVRLINRCLSRRVICLPHNRRPSIVQERHRHFTDSLFAVLQCQHFCRRKFPQDGRFNRFVTAQFLKRFPVFFWDRKHHALLSFGDPNFSVRQTFVLQRNSVQPNLGTQLFAHFTDGTGITTRTTIGNGRVKIQVARLEHHVHQHLLSDRVANLHRPTRSNIARLGQLCRTERRAVNSIASGLATDGNDQIIGLGFFERFILGKNAHVAAEH